MEDFGEFSWLPFVLQTSDPLFPTGAYAHSLGLEEIVRLGVVRDESTLHEFLKRQIVSTLANLELPYLRLARKAAGAADLNELCAIDREISAWKLSQELREASLQLGARRLKTLLQITPNEFMVDYENRVSKGKSPGHQITVLGAQFVGVPLDAALATYVYQTLAAFCSAALKLIRIGQEGCQRVLRSCLENASAAITNSLAVTREDAGWFNPLLEIASMRHAHAFERLFIS